MSKTPKNCQALRLARLTFAGVLACGSAHGATSCAISNAALIFGNYEVFSARATDGVGTVELVCTNLDSVASSGDSVALSIGASANGTVTDRKMAAGSGTLNYAIFSDASRTRNWAEGQDVPRLPTGSLQAHESKQLQFTLYGRIPAQQNVQAGQYSDNLMVTVSP